MTIRGRFVTLEGGDGVGKTLAMRSARDEMEAHGICVIDTREPGGTPMAEGIRQLLLEQRDEAVDPFAETLLMFAARAQHVKNVIEPALASGKWVLCDRFTDSSFAYQSGGRRVPESQIKWLSETVLGSLRPDLTLYLDAPVDVAMARANARCDAADKADRFEREKTDFRERVRETYRTRATMQSWVTTIDASRGVDAVQTDVRKAVMTLAKADCRTPVG